MYLNIVNGLIVLCRGMLVEFRTVGRDPSSVTGY